LVLGDDEVVAGPGTFVLVPPGITHTLANRGDAPYPERDKGGGVFVMTEPPYTGAQYDDARGRLLRLFWRDEGLPIPPDEPAEGAPDAS
jgi:hypothetical protein